MNKVNSPLLKNKWIHMQFKNNNKMTTKRRKIGKMIKRVKDCKEIVRVMGPI